MTQNPTHNCKIQLLPLTSESQINFSFLLLFPHLSLTNVYFAADTKGKTQSKSSRKEAPNTPKIHSWASSTVAVSVTRKDRTFEPLKEIRMPWAHVYLNPKCCNTSGPWTSTPLLLPFLSSVFSPGTVPWCMEELTAPLGLCELLT